MKIKFDFVTNSSTTSYMICMPQKFDEKNIENLSANVLQGIEIFNDLDDLIVHTQDRGLDWLNEACGPNRYEMMCKEDYEKLRDCFVEHGDKVKILQVNFERSWGQESDSFEARLQGLVFQNGGFVVFTESY